MWSFKMILAPLSLYIMVFATTYASEPWTQRGGFIVGEDNYELSGRSVSSNSDGTIVAIGAPYAENYRGRVSVWEYNDTGAWNPKGEPIRGRGEASRDRSGWSVALSKDGSVVAIGAVWNDDAGSYAGHVRIFEYNGVKWTQRGDDIDGEASNDRSGWSVALSSSGDVVAIGAIYNDGGGQDAGHVRIHNYTSTGWVKRGEDIEGEASGDLSGWSVALSDNGNVVAIGAIYNDGGGQDAGHVRVYKWEHPNWEQMGADIDGHNGGDWFGNSVALSSDGTSVAIGAANTYPQYAEIHDYDSANSNWTLRGHTIDGLGHSVSLSRDGNTVAVGAPYDIRVHRYDGTSRWEPKGSNIAAHGGGFGYSVSLSGDGNVVAVGAPYADNRKGYVGVYAYPVTLPCSQYDLDPIGKSTQFRITNICDDLFIKVKMESLTELDIDKKKTKHKVTSFASTVPIDRDVAEHSDECFGYGASACLYNEFSADLSDKLGEPQGTTTLVLNTTFALQELVVTEGITVPIGGLKLSAGIENWPFSSGDGTGGHVLELCMRIMTNDESGFTEEGGTITSDHILVQNAETALCGSDSEAATIDVELDVKPNDEGNQLFVCYRFDGECDSINYDPIYSFIDSESDEQSEAAAKANTATEQSAAAAKLKTNTVANRTSDAVIVTATLIGVFALIAAGVFCYYKAKTKNEQILSVIAVAPNTPMEDIDAEDGNPGETVTVNTDDATDHIEN